VLLLENKGPRIFRGMRWEGGEDGRRINKEKEQGRELGR
jgi:hypothetical protein